MKYVIFSVWAHVCRTKSDENKVVNDSNVEVEMYRGSRCIILFERLQRSYSINGDLIAHCIEADRLQKEYDEDNAPVRAYVYALEPGLKPVPVYAGGQCMRPGFAPPRQPAPKAGPGGQRRGAQQGPTAGRQAGPLGQAGPGAQGRPQPASVGRGTPYKGPAAAPPAVVARQQPGRQYASRAEQRRAQPIQVTVLSGAALDQEIMRVLNSRSVAEGTHTGRFTSTQSNMEEVDA